MQDPRIGQYITAPDHLRGARVEEVRHDNVGTPHLLTWLVLDRPHPLGDRIIVGAEDVWLSPVAPAVLAPDAGAWA